MSAISVAWLLVAGMLAAIAIMVWPYKPRK